MVRMFRKMSRLPRATAWSRSWCTSWKSLVASAVEITNVGVTSIRSSGSSSPGSLARPPAGGAAGTGGSSGLDSTVRSRHAGSVSSSSTRWNSTWTGRPMRTWSGSVPVSSPTIRTPSSSATSAITIGSARPGTGGWRCTT